MKIKPNDELEKAKYRKQDSCSNCKHVFIKSEYDDGSDYYCNRWGGKRPLCGSEMMGEPWDCSTVRKHKKLSDTWDKWSTDHWVSAHGICNYYEQKDAFR